MPSRSPCRRRSSVVPTARACARCAGRTSTRSRTSTKRNIRTLAGRRSSRCARSSNPASAADRRHVGVTVACRGTRRQSLVELSKNVVAQLELGGGGILLEVGPALRAGKGDDIVTAREHPGERQLSRRAAPLGGELADALRQQAILVEVPVLHPWVVATEVVICELRRRRKPTCEEAAPEWAV